MRTRAALLLAVAACAAPAARAAAPVSIPVPNLPDALTYASGRVLWVTHTAHGPVVLEQALVGGGPATTLATIPRAHPASNDLQISLAANAHGFVLAARDGRQIDTGECGCDYDVSTGELVVRGAYDGATADVLRCIPPRDPNESEQAALQVAAGADGFALGGARCGTSTAVETLTAAGAATPVTAITLPTYGFGLSYAEPFLAVGGTVAGAPKTTAVHVFDTAHGTRRDLPYAKETSGGAFQALADGTLVVGHGGYANVPPAIYVWPPGAAAPHAVPGAELGELGGFVAHGSQILFAPRTPPAGQLALGLVGLDGAGLRPLGAPGAGANRDPIAFDGTTAAFLNRSCAGTSQVTVVDVTDTAAPTTPVGCPIQVKDTTIKFDRKGRGILHVVCPNGCTSDLQLYILLRPKQISTHELNRYVDAVLDSRLANAKLRLAAGPTARQVRVKLVRQAIPLLRRHHRRLRVFASTDYAVGTEVPAGGPAIVAKLRR